MKDFLIKKLVQEILKEESSAEDAISDWEESEAKKIAKDLINKYGKPDYIQPNQLVWNNLTDKEEETIWEQLIVRDMADPHHAHKDSLLGVTKLDIPEGKRDDVHRVEGVVSTAGGYVTVICDSIEALNHIFGNAKKKLED